VPKDRCRWNALFPDEAIKTAKYHIFSYARPFGDLIMVLAARIDRKMKVGLGLVKLIKRQKKNWTGDS
jgi:hypothetical protein